VPRPPREPLGALATFFGLPIVLLGVGLGFRPAVEPRGAHAAVPAVARPAVDSLTRGAARVPEPATARAAPQPHARAR
jgi:hypothetical protein